MDEIEVVVIHIDNDDNAHDNNELSINTDDSDYVVVFEDDDDLIFI